MTEWQKNKIKSSLCNKKFNKYFKNKTQINIKNYKQLKKILF